MDLVDTLLLQSFDQDYRGLNKKVTEQLRQNLEALQQATNERTIHELIDLTL